MADHLRRAEIRAGRLRARLGAPEAPGGRLPAKPARMHWRRYEAALEAIQLAERRSA
ncbi:MAG TPA: hypothetical protein VF331_27730 [Polyangiales bacterium]